MSSSCFKTVPVVINCFGMSSSGFKKRVLVIIEYLKMSSEVSKKELETPEYRRYELGEMIGKNGLENIYEFNLKGEKGFKEVEVDASGRELKTLRKRSP